MGISSLLRRSGKEIQTNCLCTCLRLFRQNENIPTRRPGRELCRMVLLHAWYDVEYLFTVSADVFDPPPKVKSAVIRMVRNKRTDLGCDEKLFKTVVKTSFNQRRKTLRNSMKPLLGKEFTAYHLPVFDKRPEQLSVEQFVELTLITDRYLKTNGNKNNHQEQPSND